ncbi:MAG: ferritin-like domain-containing protein [Deltaproteobacteria bacterium]|jgi:hypothetical protein|nr:ferritin-like domain-containing protein [Deltaproteobacteria bacterium]
MNDAHSLSRRALLGATAAGGLVACGSDPPAMTGPNPDVMPLNGLLTAEYEAIKAYMTGVGIFAAPPMGDPQAALSLALVPIGTNWMNQHRQHATVLASTIRALGGTPVEEASVTFTAPAMFTNSIANVLKLAANKEKAAAVAYNRTVRQLSSQANRQLAANIEGDETQHFIVLYALLKQLAAPNVATLVANIGEIVPKSFVATQAGAMANDSLEAQMDLMYAMM